MPVDLKHAALTFARQGRVVFPVGGDTGKRPLVRFAYLEPDVAQVERWWTRWPDAGIAWRTGDGVAVIDVDPAHGGVLDSSWPATYTERTPSGGAHLFYRTADDVRNSAGRLAPGIDVRGYHGYVVRAPTPGYTVVADIPYAPLPELPPYVVQMSSPDDGPPPGWRPFEQRDHVPRGEQHSYIMSFGAWLWHSQTFMVPELELMMWHEAVRVFEDWGGPADEREQKLMRARVEWLVGHDA